MVQWLTKILNQERRLRALLEKCKVLEAELKAAHTDEGKYWKELYEKAAHDINVLMNETGSQTPGEALTKVALWRSDSQMLRRFTHKRN